MTQTISKQTIDQRLNINLNELKILCQKWQIAEIALFGSILTDHFNSESDLDLLITYLPTAKRGLLEKIILKEELENLFKRPVDLVSKKAIETSSNWIRKEHILNSLEVLYVS